MRCVCMHGHLTTKGPCTRWDTCGCTRFVDGSDTPENIAQRQVALLDGVASCTHSMTQVTSTWDDAWGYRSSGSRRVVTGDTIGVKDAEAPSACHAEAPASTDPQSLDRQEQG